MFSKVCKYMSEINYQLSDTPSSTYILLCQIMASKAASLLKKNFKVRVEDSISENMYKIDICKWHSLM